MLSPAARIRRLDSYCKGSRDGSTRLRDSVGELPKVGILPYCLAYFGHRWGHKVLQPSLWAYKWGRNSRNMSSPTGSRHRVLPSSAPAHLLSRLRSRAAAQDMFTDNQREMLARVEAGYYCRA